MFQAPDYGILTGISFYANAVSGTISMSGALWNFSGTAGTPYIVFVAQDTGSATGINTTPQLVTVTMNNVPISAGTWYGLSLWGSSSYNFYFDAGSVGQAYYQYFTTFRNYLSDDTGSATSNDKVSIYGTYTPRTPDATVYKSMKGATSTQGLSSIQGLKEYSKRKSGLYVPESKIIVPQHTPRLFTGF